MANPQVGGFPERKQEDKQREDFATGNYPSEIIGANEIKSATKAAMKNTDNENKKPKNFDVNYISNEVFEKELAYLAFTPQSDLVLLLGPKVKVPAASKIKLSEDVERKLLSDELDKLGQSFRVLGISQRAGGVTMDGKFLPVDFKVGDYVIYKGNLTVLKSIEPQDDNFSYYQIKHMDILYSTTQEQVERFKPVTE